MKCYQAGCPDGYYEDVPDSNTNKYINFSISNGCYKPISCKPGYYPNRAFYDQLESPVATYKNFTCFPARYFVDFGCPMLNNDIECSKNGEGWHIVGRSYHTNTGEPLPGSVTITISGSKGCDGSLTYTDSDFPGTNNPGEQKCYYKTGCTDVIGATYTSKTSDPRVEVIIDCSENSDFECPAGYSSEKPDDRYFVYNTEDWNNTATGKVTTCYNTTGCKEGYTQYDNGTTGYTSTDGFVCYKNSSCDNSNGWYSDMPDDIYFNYETQDLGDGLYCYRVTGCNADNGYIADDNGYISWHNVKCGDDTCPDGWYFDIPNNRDVFEYETGPSKVLQMPDWCYRITGCKDGYTSVNNGSSTVILDTPSGYACYKENPAIDWYVQAYLTSKGTGTSAQCCLHTNCYNAGKHPQYSNGVVIRLLNDKNAVILSTRDQCQDTSSTETCYQLSYLPAGQTCGGGTDIRVVTDDGIYKPEDVLTDPKGQSYRVKFGSSPIETCPEGYEEGNMGHFACKFETITVAGGKSCTKFTGCNSGYTTVDNGTTPIACGSSLKCYEAGCPDGYYEPSTNSYEWNVVKDLMNLDEKRMGVINLLAVNLDIMITLR